MLKILEAGDTVIPNMGIALMAISRATTVMWVKQCHKQQPFGNGTHTTYLTGDLGDGANGIVLPTLVRGNCDV